jgi:hypothetical protein
MKEKRPFLLWLVCLLFLATAFTELLKAIAVVSSWNILNAIRYQPSPVYPLPGRGHPALAARALGSRFLCRCHASVHPLALAGQVRFLC